MVFKNRTFNNKNSLILMGSFAIFISFMHIWADFFSAWTPFSNDMTTPLDVTLDKITQIFVLKPRSELLLGSVLALLFIPGHLVGTYFLHLGLKEYNNILSKLFLAFAWFGVTTATGYHYALVLIGDIVKFGNSQLLENIRLSWEIWSLALLISYSIAFIILTYIILTGKSLYPRWAVLFSPIVTISLLSGFTLLLPENLMALRSFLAAIGLNGPIFIFYIVAFYILIKKQEKIELNISTKTKSI